MSTTGSHHTSTTGRSVGTRSQINRLVAGIFGATFILAGLAGFLERGRAEEFIGQNGHLLFGLSVNGLHNVVHILLGAVLLMGAMKGESAARGANLVVGLGYAVVALIGYFIVGTALNLIALNQADNLFHLVMAVVLAGVALMTGAKKNSGAIA